MKKSLRLIYFILMVISLTTLLSSCSKKKPRIPTQLTATQYLNLASQATTNTKTDYQFAAADKFIAHEQPLQAKNVLNQINPDLTPQQSIEKQLLQAKVYLLEDQLNLSLKTLTALNDQTPLFTKTQSITWHQLLANAYEASGDTLASVLQRIALQPLLNDSNTQHLNLVAIWHSIQILSPQQLSTSINNASSDALKGWLSLALITKQANSPNALVQQIRLWENQYPNHPALQLLPQNITQSVAEKTPPRKIALLLPLHGRLSKTGSAIRNGFLAAYYAAEKKQLNPPQLNIYDTSKSDVVALYNKAKTDGARLIIGPLLKTNIQKLIDANVISVPTLALNTLANTTNTDNLYQFGLSPLDEAQQAANYAWKQGNKQAIIITSNNDWGQSIANVFRQTWLQLGGTVTTQLNTNNSDTPTQTVSRLLNIDLANQDYQALKKLLSDNIRFIPRRRKDVNMIYLVEQPKVARQIVPLLKYFYAGDIPVYSISQIYDGKNNTKLDHDLNGVYFCDMPWVLDPNNESDQLKKLRLQIETVWPASYSNHKKLYALGIDAFLVASKLQQMQTMPQFAIRGATGDLYLDQASHIFRQLRWTQFKNGHPAVLELPGKTS